MSEKVLVVDDEESILTLIKFNLEKAGLNVITADEGKKALAKAKEEKPDLIILDIMLPGMDGMEICKRLRKEDNNIPILMLTAKDEEIDKILGLEIGADDYMTKPFSIRELMARVKAMLRRSLQYVESKDGENKYMVNDLVVFPDKYEVFLKGENIILTPKEFELLELLVRNKGNVLDRNFLLTKIWGYDYYGDTRIVDVHISNLREKIEDKTASPKYIKTVRGVGYKCKE